MKFRNLWIAVGVIVLITVGVFVVRSKQQSVTATSASSTVTDTAFVPTYPCTAGGTALAALQTKYPVDTKDTSFGKQIIGINNVVPANNQFWAFYIDNASATIGADAYQCKGTETISWKLDSF